MSQDNPTQTANNFELSRNRLKQTFGKIPQAYDDARPGYPPEIYADILAQLTPTRPLRILEIGCGTGKATALFVKAGHTLLALDISAELIAIARQHFEPSDSVRFEVCSFEQLDWPESSLDLIFAASAIHWVAPEFRFKKTRQLLAPGGVLAILWNDFDMGATPLLREVGRVCQEHVPAFPSYPEPAPYMAQREIEGSGLFGPIARSERICILPFSPGKFMNLLTTFSWFQSQSKELQSSLLDALGKILASAETGIDLPTKTILLTATPLKQDQKG